MDNTYTKKQRKAIYIKAFKIQYTPHLIKEERINYVCHSVAKAASGDICNYSSIVNEDAFPELFMFRDHDDVSAWLSHDYMYKRGADEHETKLIVLLLCAEMCS